jgi:hypothetical protein
MTPETPISTPPQVENSQKQIETKPLTPEQKEQRVLEEALELS